MKIKNISDFKNADKRLGLQKIPEKNISIVTVDNFWDGPLSGECQWNGDSYYYECFDQVDPITDTDVWPRKFLVLRLTEEEREKNRKLKDLFDLSANSEMLREKYLQTLENSPEFIIQKDQVVGWFEFGTEARSSNGK